MAATERLSSTRAAKGRSGGGSAPISVLVVDDSAFARSVISRRINAAPDMDVVGQARDGIEAVELVNRLQPDVVTMDVTMPRLDGIGAVQCIMASRPTPIVMLSALTGPGADVTIQALELGAVDFFLKPSITTPTGAPGASGASGASELLLDKLRVAAGVHVSAEPAPAPARPTRHSAGPPPGGAFKTVIVIGTSTGGPKALAQVLPALPADLDAAVLVVQHMPPKFTASLAKRLDGASEIKVTEAAEGDKLERGVALIAPGGFHLTVDRSGVVALNTDAERHGVRPSVDVSMLSVAASFPGVCRGVILTGMGSDGRDGCGAIKAAGGSVIVEHESTCAVYGMPKSVSDAGYADRTVPLGRIAREIERLTGVAPAAAVAAGR